MNTNTFCICIVMGMLLASPHIRQVNAQPLETWLSFDGGYTFQKSLPLDLNIPVEQRSNGSALALSLLYGNDRAEHGVRFSYLRQQDISFHPADLPSFADRYVALTIDYQYTRYHFRDIGGLPLSFGTGPYLFVANQIIDYRASPNSTVEYNELMYGGGINITLQYLPEAPISLQLTLLNGGHLGSQEVNRENSTFSDERANGWLAEVNGEVSFRLNADWQIFAFYNWAERTEHVFQQNQRRTFQHVNLGIRYRLEDD
ncbi:MAG: hypothetical protein R3281_04675 [Balneolaceae bacterium]|nr:hypothetical protein [Balneolaceae bacterium]